MVKKNFLKSSLIIAIVVAMMLPVIPTMSFAVTSSNKPSITYSAHMQTYGWDKVNQKPGTALGEAKTFAGVTGESKRMEALEINVIGAKLEYRAHVQGKGWMDWVEADDTANHKATVGTTGESKRVEALQLSVKGLEGYSILYRAHVQGEGWMDWVDAADPTAYAGTEGRSLRMEAFEIVVLPDNEFYYVDNHNGTHTSSYNGKLGATEDCVYGDYTVKDGKFTKTCALCGYSNGETKSLQGVLTDAKLDGQSKVNLENVTLSENLEIPEGMTLEVDENINTNGKDLVVNGHLITKSTSGDAKITCGENGVITYRGVYDKQDNVLSSTLKASNTLLKHIDKIVLEKGSKDQDLGNSAAVVPADAELVLDLNETKVTSSVSADDAIVNNGKLTINDGVFDVAASRGIRTQGKDSELVVNNCTMTGTSGRAIAVGEESGSADTNVKATITNTKITMTDDSDDWAVAAFGKDVTVNMKNVEIKTKAAGIYTNADNSGNKSIFNCENVIINADDTAIYFGSEGTYTLNNSTITGHEGIEYTVGTLTLNNTNVTGNGTPTITLSETRGEGTFTTATVTGQSNGFGSAIQIKQLSHFSEKTAELNVNGSSKVTSEHAPAVLVFSSDADLDDTKVKLHYPTDSLSGYTKENVKGSPVVWAVKA